MKNLTNDAKSADFNTIRNFNDLCDELLACFDAGKRLQGWDMPRLNGLRRTVQAIRAEAEKGETR